MLPTNISFLYLNFFSPFPTPPLFFLGLASTPVPVFYPDDFVQALHDWVGVELGVHLDRARLPFLIVLLLPDQGPELNLGLYDRQFAGNYYKEACVLARS